MHWVEFGARCKGGSPSEICILVKSRPNLGFFGPECTVPFEDCGCRVGLAIFDQFGKLFRQKQNPTLDG